jgi:ABC-type Mn2+/Zn2+ transport system ATPase subunit
MIIDLLIQLRQLGHTILISTHDLASIKTFCDRVVLINRTILAYGNTADVFTPENISRAFDNLPSDSSGGSSQLNSVNREIEL